MRYMVMHKVDATMERGDPPSADIVERMGKLVQDSAASGVFKDGAGLHRSARRVRVSFRGNERQITRGPYAGDNELCASFAMIKAPSLDAAIEQAARFAAILGDVDIEIGPVVEPWDLGLVKKPEGERLGRFLLLVKSTPATETGAPLASETERALRELFEKLQAERVLLTRVRLAPSSRGSRLKFSSPGKRDWVDGPFTESKELIAGFSIIEVPTRDAAIAWADRYADILRDSEVDVREVE